MDPPPAKSWICDHGSQTPPPSTTRMTRAQRRTDEPQPALVKARPPRGPHKPTRTPSKESHISHATTHAHKWETSTNAHTSTLQQNTPLSLSDARLHPRVHWPHTQTSRRLWRCAASHACMGVSVSPHASAPRAPSAGSNRGNRSLDAPQGRPPPWRRRGRTQRRSAPPRGSASSQTARAAIPSLAPS